MLSVGVLVLISVSDIPKTYSPQPHSRIPITIRGHIIKGSDEEEKNNFKINFHKKKLNHNVKCLSLHVDGMGF